MLVQLLRRTGPPSGIVGLDDRLDNQGAESVPRYSHDRLGDGGGEHVSYVFIWLKVYE